jgi:hypothetical protein
VNRPAVTPGAVLDDTSWFAAHRRRRYRVRRDPQGGFWLIRRRQGRVFLRTWAAALPRMPDDDDAIRAWWFRTAWPELPAKTRAKLIGEARQLENGQLTSNGGS